MNMKKIAILALSLCMVAAIAVTGTIAYFTDTDAATNVFTTSNVSIDLIEDFEDNALLMPGMDVNKDAWIKNDGNQNAWVWAEVLIPAYLDDDVQNSPLAPGLENSLHVNYPGVYSQGHAQNTNPDGKWYNADLSKLWIHQHNADGVTHGYLGQEQIGGVWYNKYIKFYTEVLEPNQETSFFLDKVYMDAKVQQTEYADRFVLADGVTEYDGFWNIIVRAYGIQEEGFENVIDAWKAYDGVNPAVTEDGKN